METAERSSKVQRKNGSKEHVLVHTPAGFSQTEAVNLPFNSYAPPGSILENLQARVSLLEKAVASDESKALNEQRPAADFGPHTLNEDPRARHSSLVTALDAKYHAHARITFSSAFPDAMLFASNIESRHEDYAGLADDLRALNSTVKRLTHFKADHGTGGHILTSMVAYLPDWNTCTKLIDLYFENFETAHRILHRPSFEDECELFWMTFKSGSYELDATLPKLLLILSIAASLRTIPECSAVQSASHDNHPLILNTVQLWLDSLPRKQKHLTATLQVRFLMLLPQHGRTMSIDDLWIKTGEILQHATLAGLRHRRDGKDKSTFEAEIDARLWTSIVEFSLSISLMAGLPLVMSLDRLQIDKIHNINDSDFNISSSASLTKRPYSEWTDSLCQCVLADSLPLRLQAYDYMSRVQRNVTYAQVMNFARQIEQSFQQLPAPLRFGSHGDGSTSQVSRLFSCIIVDVLVRRVLLNLYTPFALIVTEDDAYRGARIHYVQSCMVLLCYQDLFDPKFSELSALESQGYWDSYYRIFRPDMVQTCLGLCFELQRLTRTGTSGSVNTNLAPSGSSKHTAHIGNWTKTTLIKTIDDTIEPMIRHLGRPGPDLKDLLCMTVAFQVALNINQPSQQRQKAIEDSVRDLISNCRRQLVKNGLEISTSLDTTPSASGSEGLFRNDLMMFSDPLNPSMNWYWTDPCLTGANAPPSDPRMPDEWAYNTGLG